MRAGDRNAALWDAIETLADHGELCATLTQIARKAGLTRDQVRTGLGDLCSAGALRAAGHRGQIAVYELPWESHGGNSENPTVQGSRETPNTPKGVWGSHPTNPTENPTVPDPKIMRAAENRIANALMHYDRESEVTEDLFGRRGLLRAFAGDPTLERRMLALWRGHRHSGERIEREQEERLTRYGGQRSRRATDATVPSSPAPEIGKLIELAGSNGNGNSNGHRTLDQDLRDLLGFDEA